MNGISKIYLYTVDRLSQNEIGEMVVLLEDQIRIISQEV